MRRLTRAIVAISLITALFLLFDFLSGNYYTDQWAIKLPRMGDHRIVGEWKGTWKLSDDPEPRHRITTFRPDGTGVWTDPERGFHLTFDWGTENGVIFTKRMATDAWSGTNRLYSLSPNKQTIQFSKARTFDLVCKTMTRQESK
jgi:hypothetical protein